VIKMSEMTPSISSLVAELFPQYLDPDLYAIVNGGIPETTAILALKWAHSKF
jgi:aldehyde dehydrogenase (NAD+)